jgi:hypothetical protein
MKLLPFLIVMLLPPATSSRSPRPCYEYESDSVALRGTVIRRVYPGRPNYESVQHGDEPDTVFVLRLITPICTLASGESDAARNVREVQLYFSKEELSTIRRWLGKEQTVRGTLQGWVWGWHHLPVLLRVRLPLPASAV